MCAVIGWKSVLYESIENRTTAVTPSTNCTMFELFRDFFLAFFW